MNEFTKKIDNIENNMLNMTKIMENNKIEMTKIIENNKEAIVKELILELKKYFNQ